MSQVADELSRQGLRCFYDADQEVNLWGKDLAEELTRIYTDAAAVVVMFVSRHYAEKDWTRLERRAALSRALRERREYVLPARFDATELPGVPGTLGYVDLSTRSPKELADLIVRKVDAMWGPTTGYRQRWVHSYPAAAKGEVWLRIFPRPGREGEPHRFEIRWGPWKKQHVDVRPSASGAPYWFTKGDDGRSVPLVVEVDPPARLSFGVGHVDNAQEL